LSRDLDSSASAAWAAAVTSTSTVFPQSSPLINEENRSTFARMLGVHNLDKTDRPTSEEENGGGGGGEADEDGLTSAAAADSTPKTQLTALPTYDYDVYISRTWALVVISVAIVGIVVCLWMLVYVFQKMCDQTLQGSQTMGVLLLIAVTGLFSSVVSWLLPPNEVVCIVRHLMHPLLMALCFSILVVKTMQLRSLVTIGIAGYIPMVNQLVSLVFMVTVQIVIEAEWYFSSRPIGFLLTETNTPVCEVSRGRFLLLHIYPCALVLLAFCYGISVINYKYNSNEGRWISISLIFVIPVMGVWLVIYSFAPEEFGDPVVSVALILISALLLSILFVPKMIAISEQSVISKLNHGGNNGNSNIYSQWPQWNATHKGKSWSPQKWFRHHNGPHPRVTPFHHIPTQYGSDMYPLYSPSASGMTSNGSPIPPAQQPRYVGGRRMHRTRPRPRPLLPVYTSPKYRASPRSLHHQPFNGLNYCAAGAQPSYFYFGDDPPRQRQPSSSNRTGKSSMQSPSVRTAISPRIPAPDHQIVTKYVPANKVKSKGAGIVMGGACSCCEAGRSIPKGSVTDYNGSKRKISGSSRSSAPQQQQQQQHLRNKSDSTTSLVPSLIEADCYPGTVIITPDNESYGDEGIWTHKYDTGVGVGGGYR
jgi:hypothetical protein